MLHTKITTQLANVWTHAVSTQHMLVVEQVTVQTRHDTAWHGMTRHGTARQRQQRVPQQQAAPQRGVAGGARPGATHGARPRQLRARQPRQHLAQHHRAARLLALPHWHRWRVTHSARTNVWNLRPLCTLPAGTRFRWRIGRLFF